MRTIEEISADLKIANANNKSADLQRLAEELVALGTPNALANAELVFGNVVALGSDFQKALQHYNKALGLLEELGDTKGTAYCRNNIGNLYNELGDHAQALEYFNRALATFTDLADQTGIALITGNIGNAFNKSREYQKALEFYTRALAVHEEMSDLASVARITGNLGVVYSSVGDYPKALALYLRSLAALEERDNRSGIASVTGNIGNVYGEIGDHLTALEYYNRSLVMFREIGNLAGVARMAGEIGSAHDDLGDSKLAIENYKYALSIFEQLGVGAGVAFVTDNLIDTLLRQGLDDEASVLLDKQEKYLLERSQQRQHHYCNRAVLEIHLGNLEAARDYYLQALAILEKSGERNRLSRLHEDLRNLAQKRNDFESYIKHNTEFIRISEEVRGKEATQKLTMMEAERTMEGERKEREKERAVLYSTLPRFIADRMIRGEQVSGDHFDEAAVLFADVVGFTKRTSDMNPAHVVEFLEQLFRRCDFICEQHGITKIKTIGDSYMCFKGDESGLQNGLATARAAIAVNTTGFTWPDGEPLTMRIGMHIGPVTAGVIGTQRLQYDIWGDTVNVASRLENTSEPNRIHVSEAFVDAVQNSSDKDVEVNFVHRGDIDLKGKGLTKTYWLE